MKIKLKEIIGQFLNSADQSSHEFLRLWNMGVWGMKTEFNLDITGCFKTVLLPVNQNKTVDLPCDYISYNAIGLYNELGEIVPFKRNDQLAKVNKNKPNRLDGLPMVQNTLTPYLLSDRYLYNYYNTFNNGITFHLYGAESGTITRGTYTVDEKAKVIYLGLGFSYPSEIAVRYLSGEDCDDFNDFEIDIQAAYCMMSFIRWKDIEYSKKYSQSEIRLSRKEYYNQKRLTKMRINKVRIVEMNDIIRRSINLTPKA